MGSFLITLYRTLASRKIGALLGFVVLFIFLSFFSFNKIQLSEDISHFLPKSEDTQQIEKILKQVNLSDKIVLLFSNQGTEKHHVKMAKQWLDSIKPLMDPFIAKIDGYTQGVDLSLLLEYINRNLPLYLNDKDYAQIQNLEHPDSLDKTVKQIYKNLFSPSSIFSKKQLMKDPLGLAYKGLEKFKILGQQSGLSFVDGFLSTEDGENIILFLTPKNLESETAKNEKFAELVQALQTQLNKDFEGLSELTQFGGTFVGVANAKQIKLDIQTTVSIAILIFIVLLILFYKNLATPFFLLIPTVFGILGALFVLSVFRPQISSISLGIGAVLIGVTLDYALHVLTHLRKNPDIETLYRQIANPILISAFTTTIAFMCLVVLPSKAMVDLGLFAGISIFLSAVFALLLLPLLYKGNKVKLKKINFLEKIALFHFEKSKFLWLLVGALALWSIWSSQKVNFNKDLNALNYFPSSQKLAQQKIENILQRGSKTVYLISFSKETEEAILEANDIEKWMQLKKEEGKIKDYQSIASLLPNNEKAEREIGEWNTFWDSKRKLFFEVELNTNAKKYGFQDNSFQSFSHVLNKPYKPINIEDEQEALHELFSSYLSHTDSLTTVTSIIHIDGDYLPQNLQNELSQFKHTQVVDRKALNELYLGGLQNQFKTLMMYSFFAVLFISLLYYQSVSLTLITLLPLMLSWFIILGIMGAFGISFNIFNIIISTFVFGMGIDYCFFITQGLIHQNNSQHQVFGTYKTSVLLSMITTLLGVGVLIFSKHPALKSIALISVVSIICVMLMAFAFLPWIYKLLQGDNESKSVQVGTLLGSVLLFLYFGIGAFLLSICSVTILRILPLSKKVKMNGFHKTLSKFMKSVLYLNPFVKKEIIGLDENTFSKPSIVIANHTSFLDILCIGMLNPKFIFFVNDWVYYSPIFGRAVRWAGFYSVSKGLDKGMDSIREKVNQGYSIVVFPEGTRSLTHKVNRFKKGALYLAKELNLPLTAILIHGNAKVLPKNDFVIRNGTISMKILPKIFLDQLETAERQHLERKNLTLFFREKFNEFRIEKEGAKYFNSTILNLYRFQKKSFQNKVKSHLKTHIKLYNEVAYQLESSAYIWHISEDKGELDCLVMIKNHPKNIHLSSPNKAELMSISQGLLTHYGKLELNNLSDFPTLPQKIDTLLIGCDFNIPLKQILREFNGFKIVLYSKGVAWKETVNMQDEYQLINDKINLRVYNRKKA